MFLPRAFRLVVVAAFIALPATFALAGPQPPPTNILFGFVSSSRTLTVAPPGPVYSVIGDLVVMPGVTLTVEPGVTLRMALTDTLQGGDYPTNVEVQVFGTLSADASSGDSVRFLSSGAGGIGEWGQIKVEAGGVATIRKAALRAAAVGFNARPGGTFNLSDAAITSCGTVLTASGNVSVVRLIATSCNAGLELTGASGTVRECTLSGRGFGSGLMLGSGISTMPFDSTDVTPMTVSNFYYGVLLQAGALARNILSRDNQVGFVTSGGGPQRISYCTAVRNVALGLESNTGGYVLNSISSSNGGTGLNLGGFADYCDVWSNPQNVSFGGGTQGPHFASFNPFFVDPASNNFRLASGSIFKTFSNSGGEIGAYGPGPGQPVSARQTSWGRLKALYR